ncbi:MAG: arginine--tRNA ligase [Deltaproteobacteria bacterium RBG_16_58_17]|nr:MAG: arginine--tRNA ligase [Deltaproteobacteria bacterium RBG_16_58_17]OHE16980.1 MAG: arginine--tRNA ligase [Syntrophobacterales bacterium GWC2_56_13]OHE20104.1 MAG: arginine--tRNA ligase [Syntrophobacterales bacterium GWF2_56_9]
MKRILVALLERAIRAGVEAGLLPATAPPSIEVELTKDPGHGDYASNVAMILASQVRKDPREIAGVLSQRIEDPEGFLEKIEIAGPGFMNFFIREGVLNRFLADVERESERYGSSDLGKGGRVQVEFVSANPTGPLHIGHARGAVVGDVMANILAAAGYRVFREYYINDTGNQMNNLGLSVFLRYRELLGEAAEFPEGCYRGDYIRDLAAELLKRDGKRYLDMDAEEAIRLFTDYAGSAILGGIKDDLRAFGVVFDLYFSERELYREEGVGMLLRALQDKGFIYREGDALWFRTTAFGDEKDRVVIRQNGAPTYFAADIAYHRNKFLRGFETVIDIWGADHHGYIPRMSAAVQALGYEKEALKVILVQLVNLLREGKPVAMSTRSGEFVTLREVVDEVGKDAARYNFLMRRSDSHLDFDLEVAKRQSNENPVYYVQYAHARICSIIRMAAERGIEMPAFGQADPGLLKLPEEIDLIKAITRFPEVVEGAARTLEPHRLTFYLNDLAAGFHSYYNKNKVISDDAVLTAARLFLVKSVLTVLKNTLKMLGVSAPEKM